MITIRLSGGLGNQMFLYAVGKSLAIRQKTSLTLDARGYFRDFQWYSFLCFLNRIIITLRLDRISLFKKISEIIDVRGSEIRAYELGYFPISSTVILGSSCKIILLLEYLYFKYFNKGFPINNRNEMQSTYKCPRGVYDAMICKLDDVYLEDLWPCYEYFKQNSSVATSDFIFPDVSGAVDNWNMIDTSPNSVCIHVRRGDYVQNKDVNDMVGVCGLMYYIKGISYISQNISNPIFFVFSDDIEWAKNNLTFPSEPIFMPMSERGIDDLHLMSRCKHFIISNSTFSWWAAFLSTASPNKIVVAPSNWFDDPTITISMVLDEWIVLDKYSGIRSGY
ncbi:alpha-1,2-fucosyltransferase [Methanocorpusculum sp. MG]|uniref:Alpha-1,2-fucosyltransferase n=1 Tax=Methanocorpusculum petauri TaxID=3002863 RepID=A0ABT4IGF8_9EURY|nr:alpha-1,2-fucosyltransferase [Methanocorpusculum petauri]MCZ0860829.1 alpha-1,2-fucosyltransferase [Methanocorpusculum petauri]